jgi:hypothetical protein
VFLSLTSDQGGRVIELGGHRFIVALGVALLGYGLCSELEARGHHVNGVFVSTS